MSESTATKQPHGSPCACYPEGNPGDCPAPGCWGAECEKCGHENGGHYGTCPTVSSVTPSATAFLSNPLVTRLRYIADTNDARFGGIDKTLTEAADLIERLEKQQADQSMCVLVPIDEHDKLKAAQSAIGPIRLMCGACGNTFETTIQPADSPVSKEQL